MPLKAYYFLRHNVLKHLSRFKVSIFDFFIGLAVGCYMLFAAKSVFNEVEIVNFDICGYILIKNIINPNFL